MLRLRPLSTSLLRRGAIQSNTNKIQFFNLHPNKTTTGLRTITTEATDKESIRNMRTLQNLHTTNGKEAAKKHLKLGMRKGKANNFHCNWAIQKLCDTSTEVQGLIKQMKVHKISIGVETLNSLVIQLQLEGNATEAQRVVDVVFEWEGVTPDSKTTEALATAGKLARIGLNMKLENILKSDGKQASMKYLIEIIHNGKADTTHCGWAMKELCNTSDEMRDIIQQMNENNNPIDEFMLNSLIYQLLFEDKKEEAQHVLVVDFERHGLQPDDYTRETMADADKLAGIGHTNKMKSLLKTDGKEATMNYLQEIICNGKANSINCGWALKELCNTSEEARDIILQMNENNVTFDEVILNSLINQLLFEGKKEEAQHVFDVDFERYGLQPNDRTEKAMADADKLASIGHTDKMKQLLKRDGKEASMKYLIESMNNGKASTTNCGWAMKELCNTSEEARDIISQMNENNVTIDEAILTLLINNLLFEDKKEEAQHVLDIDFERYGSQPSDRTLATMADADKLAGIGHRNKLESLLKTDGKEESMKYLQEMMYNGKANTFNCGWAMKEVCNTSDEMRDIINQMNDNNVPINEVILTQLINNLLFENKKEEAQHVLDNDFERYGLQPNDRTRKTMANADKLASIGYSRL